MKQRIITGICIGVVVLPVLYFSHTWAFPIFLSLLAVLSVYEMMNCVSSFKNWLLSVPAFIIAGASPILMRIFLGSSISFFYFIAGVICYLIYSLCLPVFAFKKYKFSEVCTAFMSTTYITIALSMLVLLRNMEYGSYLIVLAFITPWISDIFAYFVGRAIGKHKLLPDVSPKKTVEGSLGAIFFTALFCLLYGYIVSWVYNTSLKPNFFALLLIGAILSLAGQIGDLVTSAIKRNYNIKDFGTILPGHGGVLDRIDSTLMTSIIIFLYIYISDIFHAMTNIFQS